MHLFAVRLHIAIVVLAVLVWVIIEVLHHDLVSVRGHISRDMSFDRRGTIPAHGLTSRLSEPSWERS